jgi:NADH-quinone oxidoreductase subunit I
VSLERALEVVRAATSGAPPARSRGVIALLEENCTVCMLCARECPDWCISIESHPEVAEAPGRGRPRARHVLDRFAIDFGLCMYCGICIEVCPFDALFWAPEYEPAATAEDGLVLEREQLRAWMRDVPVPAPLDPAAAPPGEVEAAERTERLAAGGS